MELAVEVVGTGAFVGTLLVPDAALSLVKGSPIAGAAVLVEVWPLVSTAKRSRS